MFKQTEGTKEERTPKVGEWNWGRLDAPAEPEGVGQGEATEKVADLLAMLREEGRERKPVMRKGYWIAFTAIVIPLLALGMEDVFRNGNIWSLAPFAVTAPCALLLRNGVASRRQKEAMRALAESNDVQAVGLLAEALWWAEVDIAKAVQPTLARLLPHLRASDASLLNETQRGFLYRALLAGNLADNAELILAILTALEQVGDGKAIPFVEKLAAGEGRAAKDTRIREAAARCLPYLYTVADQEKARNTLLRASSAAGSGPDVLLRPAAGGSETDPSHLLRASVREAEEPEELPEG